MMYKQCFRERAANLDKAIGSIKDHHDINRSIVETETKRRLVRNHFLDMTAFAGALAKWDRVGSSSECGISGSYASDVTKENQACRSYWRKLFKSYREEWLRHNKYNPTTDRHVFLACLESRYESAVGDYQLQVTRFRLALQEMPRVGVSTPRLAAQEVMMRPLALRCAIIAAAIWCETYRQRTEIIKYAGTSYEQKKSGYAHVQWANRSKAWTDTYIATFKDRPASYRWEWVPA